VSYKRFLVFYAECYYPCGGEGDVDSSFDTLGEALAHIETRIAEWEGQDNNWHGTWEILDMDAREFVYQR